MEFSTSPKVNIIVKMKLNALKLKRVKKSWKDLLLIIKDLGFLLYYNKNTLKVLLSAQRAPLSMQLTSVIVFGIRFSMLETLSSQVQGA